MRISAEFRIFFQKMFTFELKPRRKFVGPTYEERWQVYGNIFLKTELAKCVAV